jgi:uncharacterized 2Fe-2S/4Fe-4S cluster protein (DUF4445 family)
MMPRTLTLHIEAGSERHLEVGDSDLTRPLADFLEDHACPLNRRCGGIGRCRGCELEIGPGRRLKACQTSVGDALSLADTFTIPARSWRDHSLSGVSAFEIRGTPPVHRPRPGLGVALDIGTTTLAAALWDLATGRCLGHRSTANPQRRFGDNVASRVGYSLDEPGATPRLQHSLIDEGLRPLLENLLEFAEREPDDLVEAVAAGNPVMLHTLAGAPLRGFAAWPFQPCFLGERCVTLSLVPDGLDVLLLPSLGAFVGADVAMGALAAGWMESDGIELLIDFGTNGEILLKHGDRYLGAATAAGPAFEGGRLHCGRAAGPGVIGSLDCDGTQWHPTLCTDESRRPVGLAGAAYIDFLHHARRTGLVNDRGRIQRDHPLATTRDIDGEPEAVAEIRRDVFVTEGDIAELLQAKAAIGGGVATLLERAGVSAADIDRLTIAGGFGFHLGKEAAASTGLIPPVPPDRLQTLGNTSLGGASLLLLHGDHRPLVPLLENCECLELNQCDSFEDHYIDHLGLA